MMKTRELTRKQRYQTKLAKAVYLPVELVTCNFACDENLGYVVRAAACFGVKRIHVIGSIPSYDSLRKHSGSMQDLVELVQYSKPSEFLEYYNNLLPNFRELISLELTDTWPTFKIQDIPFKKHRDYYYIVVGNENTGVPSEILAKSIVAYISLPGAGHCCNTAQTANIALYEISRQLGL